LDVEGAGENRNGVLDELRRIEKRFGGQRGALWRPPGHRSEIGKDAVGRRSVRFGMDSRRDGGVDSGIDLRRHEAAPENLGSVLSDLRLRLSAKNA
jgi:hypothetical protein